MKTISTVFIFICVTAIVGAQSFKDQFFSSLGFSPFLDFGASPAQVNGPFVDPNTGNLIYTAYQTKYAFAPAFSYEGRYNLMQSGDNMAVSIKATPTISGVAQNGVFGFYFPIGAGLELGNGATYQTTANMGFSFTAGYSLNVAPLIKESAVTDEASKYNVTYKSSWGCPYIALGIRYWNKKNKLREISIRYGFGSSGDSVPTIGDRSPQSVSSVSSSYILRVSWMKYINY